jgi:WbqC-like protein family
MPNSHGPEMPKTAVILQSNYIPWKGYFDLLLQADIFIVFDCVQYTRLDWRNRNLVKTPSGRQWLSIPVAVRYRDRLPIDRVEVAAPDWAEQHIRSVVGNYRRARDFDAESDWVFEALREAGRLSRLSEINVFLLNSICERIGIKTPIVFGDRLVDRGALVAMKPTERLIQLCKSVGATCYLSGPAAKTYLDIAAFASDGIAISWMDYSDYPPYPQLWGEFIHGVSIIDLVLNVGAAEALSYIRRRNPKQVLPPRESLPSL